jgi:hypothetical protein
MLVETVGLTKDNGWQVGVRKTLPIAPDDAWEFLFSEKILRLWLGVSSEVKISRGAQFHLDDGTFVKITTFKPNSHVRLQFQPPGYEHPTIVQVRLIPSGENTVFAFHQERLPDWGARKERKYYFQQALDDFAISLVP